MRPCLEPLCKELVERGRCVEHELEHDITRHVYSDPRWEPARQACFARDGYRCRRCGFEDVTRTGTGLQANHVPKLRWLLELGRDPFDIGHLETTCGSCHSRVTALGG